MSKKIRTLPRDEDYPYSSVINLVSNRNSDPYNHEEKINPNTLLLYICDELKNLKDDNKIFKKELYNCLKQIDEIKNNEIDNSLFYKDLSILFFGLIKKANQNENIEKIGYSIKDHQVTLSYFIKDISFTSIHLLTEEELKVKRQFPNLVMEFNYYLNEEMEIESDIFFQNKVK